MEAIFIIKTGEKLLKNCGIENPLLEAEILFSHLMNIERYKIYTEKIYVPSRIARKFFKLIEMRKEGIPLPYITKKVYFYNCEFKIEKGVFIPRPETELLVEKTIQIYKENFSPQKVKILDIGTGCGNITVSLAKNIENCYVKGIDISKKALKIAKENSILNKTEDKTDFFYSNLFFNINEKFEIIVSNPPYVSKKDYYKLGKEVREEPKRALYGGENGIEIIRRIVKGSKYYLKKKGFLILEIGYGQSEKLKKIIPDGLKLISIDKDFSKIDRIAVISSE